MKNYSLIFSAIILMIASCSSNDNESKEVQKEVQKETLALEVKEESIEYPEINVDLDEILEAGKLKVSTTYSGTSYFLYRGKAMGFEYELLEHFAESIGVELEIIVAHDIDNLIPNLQRGKVDLMAHGMTVTGDRKKEVDFTDYIYLTHQVLIQKKPDNWRQMNWSSVDRALIHDAIELRNQTVSIREETAYFERIQNLSEEIGEPIIVDTLDGTLATEDIIKMVADGEVKYTIADDNIANIIASYYPVLDVGVPISFSQQASWATRNSSPKLLKALNEWLKVFKKKIDYYMIYNKYFKNERDFKRRSKSDFYSLNSNKISKYDDLIKRESKNIDWDWRLVSALIYQESRFDPSASSWAGAGGLMQIMPATARELGVVNRNDPSQSVRGGTKYLRILFNRFDEIKDDEQRRKFAMASYNCGYGHVLDAQRLAIKRGLDKTKWDDNVEKMILALSSRRNFTDPVVRYGYVRGLEPYNYVQHITERYLQYKEFIE